MIRQLLSKARLSTLEVAATVIVAITIPLICSMFCIWSVPGGAVFGYQQDRHVPTRFRYWSLSTISGLGYSSCGLVFDHQLINSDRLDTRETPDSVAPSWASPLIKRKMKHLERVAASKIWIVAHAAGWPLRCFRCAYALDAVSGQTMVTGGIVLPWTRSDVSGVGLPVVIPVEPVYLNCIVNICTIIVIWYCVRWSVRTCRYLAKQRFDEHCCAKCGYDVRGLLANACPECGTSVPCNAQGHDPRNQEV